MGRRGSRETRTRLETYRRRRAQRQVPRRARLVRQPASKQNFTACKLLFTDVVDGVRQRVRGAPCDHRRGQHHAGRARGIGLPEADITRAKNPPREVLQENGPRPPPGSVTDDAAGSGAARPHPQAAAPARRTCAGRAQHPGRRPPTAARRRHAAVAGRRAGGLVHPPADPDRGHGRAAGNRPCTR